MGEIGLFSPSLSRTATARSEEDGTVFSISHDRIYQLFFQEPRFAFFIVRLITGRLIENMEQMAQRYSAPVDASAMVAQETKRASQARSVADKLRWRRRFTVGTTAALLVIALVGFGLSLRPLTFHDATITTWIQATTAPISGDFVDNTVAVSAAEAAERELIELQRQRNLHLKAESELKIRLDSAQRGLFLVADGKEADWAYRERDQLELELEKTRRDLRDNQAALERAVEKAQVLQAAWEARSMATASGPAGLTVWSMPATPGSTVRVGEPIALLVDCNLELVDLRLPDSEIILVDKTMSAEVRLEGSAKVIRGHVVQLRGPASILGQNDLAADALGTDMNDWGQVLIQLDRSTIGEQPSAPECRIGRNAYVDFPEVSTWSLILSWLYARPY